MIHCFLFQNTAILSHSAQQLSYKNAYKTHDICACEQQYTNLTPADTL